MSHSLKKIIPLFVVCLLTQGCVGVAVMRTRTQTFQNPVIMESIFISGLSSGDPKQPPHHTSAWLEAHWGKPTSVRHTGEGGRDEIWTYKFQHVWVGAGAMVVIVPVPLCLPVVREKAMFIIRDGQVIAAKNSTVECVGVVAGYMMGGGGGGGWIAGSGRFW
jgi:hypothetical protein